MAPEKILKGFTIIQFFKIFLHKSMRPEMFLPLITPKSTQGYHLYNLVELSREFLMLHAKNLDHRANGSEKEDFEDFTIYGRGGHLGLVNVHFPFRLRLQMKFRSD